MPSEPRNFPAPPGQASAGPSPAPPPIATPPTQDESLALVRVLSRFDLGVIDAIAPVALGSDTSRKWLLRTRSGRFLLKRRAPNRADPALVSWAHAVQITLTRAGFPAPRLVGTRPDNASFVRDDASLYELFEFIDGVRFDRSPPQARQSGDALARFHAILAEPAVLESLAPRLPATPGRAASALGYHAWGEIDAFLGAIPSKLAEPSLAAVVQSLRAAYARAAEHVQSLGIAHWPSVVVHSDWHPGNLLFRRSVGDGATPSPEVVAALDFDTCRLGPRVLDVANGALQFSLTRTEGDLDQWPAGPDEARLTMFIAGYDSACPAAPGVLSQGEIEALPGLMIEALIAEPAATIATTGRFGPMNGGQFLRLVERKVRWLVENQGRIAALLG